MRDAPQRPEEREGAGDLTEDTESSRDALNLVRLQRGLARLRLARYPLRRRSNIKIQVRPVRRERIRSKHDGFHRNAAISPSGEHNRSFSARIFED